MSRLVVARRVLVGLLAVIVVVAVVAGVLVVTALRSSLPTHSGEATLPGLSATVTVKRDDSGVPHIYGDSVTDLARAQGYVHAQERFFEMDLRRHITAGRLAELVGPAGVQTDKVIRTMGWRRIAEEELPTLEPETRQVLQAYADGVNRYLRGRSPGDVSAEYTVLGLQNPLGDIEEWTPVDSLAWLKAMAWDLRGDYSDELARARLTGRVSRAQIGDIYPAYDAEAHPPILSTDEWSPGSTSAAPAAASAPDETTGPRARAAYAQVEKALHAVPQLVGRGEGVGSNSWVVSGARTPAASRCSPTTRTSASASPASGSRTASRAARSGRSARSTSRASRSPACRASSSATTDGSPGASPTSARTSPTSTSSASSARPTCATATGSR